MGVSKQLSCRVMKIWSFKGVNCKVKLIRTKSYFCPCIQKNNHEKIPCINVLDPIFNTFDHKHKREHIVIWKGDRKLTLERNTWWPPYQDADSNFNGDGIKVMDDFWRKTFWRWSNSLRILCKRWLLQGTGNGSLIRMVWLLEASMQLPPNHNADMVQHS